MSKINNLNSGGSNEIKRRLWQSEVSSNLGHSSISRGALKINSEEGLQVNGSSYTTGKMGGSGEFNWTGTCNLDGPVSATKSLDVTGATRLRAATTMEADLTVTSGGSIKVGATTLHPTGGKFGGGKISNSSGGLVLESPVVDVSANLYVTALLTAKNAEVDGRVVSKTLQATALPTISGKTANIWADPATGQLYRIL